MTGAESTRDLDVNRLADAIAARLAAPSPWLDAAGAAEYLSCSVSRIRTLTATRDLPVHHDGRRPLYHRDELDEYVRRGGARCP